MKKELLCPVGSMDAFYAAVHAGADAVYLGGKSFGARSAAPNFTEEEIKDVIKYAHLYDVLVYVTVNTLIKDEEIDEALNFVEFLHENNVDAVILQDIGFSALVHKTFPNLIMHASTQMHNLDLFTCKFLKNLGFKRVVVARELSLDEINKLDTDLEIETFIHGALCISYSGECLLSSMAMNRSGNRGACSQLCRMPYKLYINDEYLEKSGNYLLSPKDLNTKNIFDEIMDSNIKSLKIEGRMKSSEYVYVVTKMYRKLIDGFYSKKVVDVTEEEKMLNQLFNRGYSTGHLKNEKDFMNIKRGNHKGVKIGDVVSVNEKYIDILLTDSIHVGDGVKFDKADKGLHAFNIYKNREIIKDGVKGDLISIPNKIGLKEKDTLLKTVDVLLNDSLKNYEKKKINVDITIDAYINKPLKMSISDGNNSFEEYGEIVLKAKNKEVTKDDIIEKATKLGSTPFVSNSVVINKDDNIFIRLSDLNNLRRSLTDRLISIRENKKTNFEKVDYKEEFIDFNSNIELSVYIRNQLQLDVIKKYPVKRIYTNNYNLYEANKDLNIYYEVNINESKEFLNEKLLINSTSDIEKYKDNDLVLGYGLNIYNSLTINYLNKYGIVTYSSEFTLNEYKKINRKIIASGEALIYGKVKVMTLNHCLLHNKPICDTCKHKNSQKNLEDSFNRKYEITCHNGINYLYDHKDILKIKDLEELKFMGIKKFRIDFFNEREANMRKVLEEFYNQKELD